MDSGTRLQLNLNVLRRYDPSIAEILDSCSHVVVYQFSEADQTWTKHGVEGTLFLFRRTQPPVYGFLIMNRLGIENLFVFLSDKVDLQMTTEYIIYRKDQSLQPDGNQIFGLWVFEPRDRERVSYKLEDLRAQSAWEPPAAQPLPPSTFGSNSARETPQMRPARAVTPSSAAPAPVSVKNGDSSVDVMGLLQRAFDAHEYRTKQAAQTNASGGGSRGNSANWGKTGRRSPERHAGGYAARSRPGPDADRPPLEPKKKSI